MICGYEVHEAAELFPLITGTAFEYFVMDMITNGQMEPVVLDRNGKIIDGRNRARAFERMGKKPNVKVYDGDDVLQYVISQNLHRRDLTDSQRAMIAAKLATRSPGMYTRPGQIRHIRDLPPTVARAAEMFSVSTFSVERAKIVRAEGSPELVDATTSGAIPVHTAARVAREMDHAAQAEFVDAVKSGVNPSKAAPPSKPERDPLKPTVYGSRRKHVDVIDAIVHVLEGAQMALKGVSDLDASITTEQATRLTRDLSDQIRSLSRINNLIKERTREQ